MHKLFWTALIVGGVVTFVGADVVGSTVRRAREAVRSKLTADVPLRTQLAEAQAQVDALGEEVDDLDEEGVALEAVRVNSRSASEGGDLVDLAPAGVDDGQVSQRAH